MQRSEGLGAKAPNKEDQHSAERLEGSGLIEENVANSHTGRTPRRKAVSQGLDAASREEGQAAAFHRPAAAHHRRSAAPQFLFAPEGSGGGSG